MTHGETCHLIIPPWSRPQIPVVNTQGIWTRQRDAMNRVAVCLLRTSSMKR